MYLPLLARTLETRAASTDIAIETDSKKWTYEALHRLVCVYSEALIGMGLPRFSRIAVPAKNSVEVIALMIALGKFEHISLPISPSISKEVKDKLYKQAQIYCELHPGVAHMTGESGALVVNLQTEESHRLSCKFDYEAALLLTTSGSTGIPKVVILTVDGINNFVNWAAHYFEINQGSRVFSYAPLCFDLSLLEVWTPLFAGGTVILSDSSRTSDPMYVQQRVKESKADLIEGVPVMYELLTKNVELIGLSNDFSHQPKHVIFTGGIVPSRVRKAMTQMFPKSIYHNIYGCSETNNSFIYTCLADEVSMTSGLPIGSPISNTEYKIMHSEERDGVDVALGLLYVKTPFMFKGYTDDIFNSEAFFNTFENGGDNIFYRTGDVVFSSKNGEIFLRGREDFIVKIRGVRINLLEVEEVLSGYPGVSRAVAFIREEDAVGSAVCVVIQIDGEVKISRVDLRIYCAKNLPRESIPSRIYFAKDALPMTSTGKPDRRKISSLFSY